MRKISCTFILLFSFVLLELHNIVPARTVTVVDVVTGQPKQVTEKVSLFIKDGTTKSQSVAWYIKDNAEMLVWILLLAMLLTVGNTCDIKRILFVHLLYRALDLFMYWYDFRQSYVPYVVFYILVAIFAMVNLIKDVEPKKQQ